jgi:hypothetical protein
MKRFGVILFIFGAVALLTPETASAHGWSFNFGFYSNPYYYPGYYPGYYQGNCYSYGYPFYGNYPYYGYYPYSGYRYYRPYGYYGYYGGYRGGYYGYRGYHSRYPRIQKPHYSRYRSGSNVTIQRRNSSRSSGGYRTIRRR